MANSDIQPRRVDVMANSDNQMQMDENLHIICQIVRAILSWDSKDFHCGDNEDLTTTNYK